MYFNWLDKLKVLSKSMCCLGLFCKRMMQLIFLHEAIYFVKEKALIFVHFLKKLVTSTISLNNRFANFDLLRAKVELFNNSIEANEGY